MRELSDDKITGLLMSKLEAMVREFFGDEIKLIEGSAEDDAPGLDEIIDQVSIGQLGLGGTEYIQYKTDLEQAMQGERRADKYVEHVAAEIERWTAEHAEFLQGLITGPLADEGLAADVDRVRKLAELLEQKQDAFPPLLIAIYSLGPGWDRVFAEQ
jgi:hypothetical protein